MFRRRHICEHPDVHVSQLPTSVLFTTRTSHKLIRTTDFLPRHHPCLWSGGERDGEYIGLKASLQWKGLQNPPLLQWSSFPTTITGSFFPERCRTRWEVTVRAGRIVRYLLWIRAGISGANSALLFPCLTALFLWILQGANLKSRCVHQRKKKKMMFWLYHLPC